MPFLLPVAASIGFILLDFLFLKKQDGALYRRVIQPFSWPVAVYGAVVLLLAFFENRWDEAPLFFFVFAVPVYLFRRGLFKKQISPARKQPETLGLSLALILDFFDILLRWFLGMIVCGMSVTGVSKIFPLWHSDLGEVVFISVVAPLLFLGLVIRSNRKYPHPALSELLGLRRQGLSLFRLVFLPALGGLVMAGISGTWIFFRETQPSTPLNQLVETTSSAGVLLSLFMAALFLAPLVEEILFRGYLYYVLETIRGRLAAVIVITVLFAALHVGQYWGDWAAIVMVGLLGLLLTLQRMWARSSIPGIIMHFTYNGAVMVVPVLFLLLRCPAYYEFQAGGNKLGYPQKEDLLSRSIAQSPQLAAPYNDLAWVYAEQGKNLPQALEMVDKALVIEPGNSAFLDTKAEVLFKMGRMKESEMIAGQLVRDNPGNAYFKEQLNKFKKGLPP